MRTPLVALAATLLLAARPPGAPKTAAVAASGGGAYVAVYLKPLSASARTLNLKAEGISVVREDGTREALSLVLPDWGGESVGRQRLLAWGMVPPGTYSGLAIRLRSATFHGEDGLQTVDLRDSPFTAPSDFTIGATRAAVIVIGFDDTASHRPEGGFAPAFEVSVPSKTASGLIGAVSSRVTGMVTLFDKVSGQVIAAIPAGRGAGAMALDPQRNRLYVALAGEDAIATIDLLSGVVIATAPLRGGDEPVSIALTPDVHTLLVANAGSSSVAFFDTSGPTLVERSRVAVGGGPNYVLADPSGARAWVFCTLDDAVTVLSLPGGLVAGTVASPGGPLRGELSRNGSRLFVIHATAPYVDAVDTTSLTVTQRAFVGPGATSILVDPKTDRIYLGFRDSRRIEIYDPGALLPIDAIRMESGAGYLTIESEGNNLCVLLPATNEARLVRISGKAIVAGLDVPEPAEAILAGGR